ncbi:4Fe-4S dicluster domain-containing protein [Proteinivorax hydrogeniformans]|uniref:4Fe-4S dicluster domain-containing protein n=1 Tax=Proteinivorax hydrogeniformans TaxID=1826727 RepID=A0AAU8HVJ5_9FIRM
MNTVVKCQSVPKLLEVLKELTDDYQIYCPVKQDDTETFLPLEQIEQDELLTVGEILSKNEPPLYSIKSFLFPNSEVYLKFRRNHDKVDFTVHSQQPEPTIVIGGKPCDVESLDMIDKVFLQEPVDTFYKQKREQTIFITSICTSKGPNCMCEEFGVDKSEPKLSDILLIESEKTEEKSDGIYLKGVSEKGTKLIERLAELDGLQKVDNSPNLIEDKEEIEKLCPEAIKDKMEELYDSDIWEDLAMRCLGCGICTYYCPTCHCYDINDYSRKGEGVRYRSWDSCMFSDFTNMAGGHNPRPTKADRIKNRFFHKLNYFVKQQGPLACVGCGRCAKNCPVGISLNTVLQKIGGQNNGK